MQLYLTPLDQESDLLNNVRLISEEDERKALREGAKNYLNSNMSLTEYKELTRKRQIKAEVSESLQLAGISKTEGYEGKEGEQRASAREVGEKENKDINTRADTQTGKIPRTK